MSSSLHSKSNENIGCSNSLTVVKNPQKPALLITVPSNSFSREYVDSSYLQDHADGVLNGRVCSRSLYVAEDGEQSIPYTPKKAQTCKKIPAKETTSVIRTKHVNGKKMINEYVKERKINHGSYGKVVLYRNNNDGAPFAIKPGSMTVLLHCGVWLSCFKRPKDSGFMYPPLEVICKSRLRKVRVTQTETALANVIREVSIMKKLDHPNVVNLIEVIDDQKSDYLYMVLEYVEGNGICNISETPGQIDETTARQYFKDIIAGVIYLHSHNIVHGDIKPENLLLTSSGRVKIGDFSVSHAFEDDNDELGRCPGTPALTAPECCSDLVYSGKAADAWAVGVTLYYMVVGCYPFLAGSMPETYDKILNGPLSLPEELDPDLKDLLQGLLCKDPMQRITIDVAAKHPWVVKDGGPVPQQSSCSCRLNS